MKILFQNVTKYDKENCDNFLNFHNKKYGKKELIKFIFLILCAIYVFVFNLIYKNWKALIILIAFGGGIYLINEYRKEKNKKESKRIKQYTFYFYEKYIKIKYKKQFERITYFEIKKIFETDKNFFFYTDDKHSIILDKEGFIIGDSKEFSKFIKKKCPFKYNNENK